MDKRERYCIGLDIGTSSVKGVLIDDVLANNDAYHALQKSGGLIITGATGTNVNDVAVALLRAE